MARQYTNIKRLHSIVSTLIKYGFGPIVAELNVLPYSWVLRKVFYFNRRAKGQSVPVRLRLMLEELGPTFVKLGQVASTRADLLPSDWVEEFKKLQDMVPPDSTDDIKRIVEEALHAPLSSVFASFDTKPVASASVAQVHYATLLDGTEVAVKVRRPAIAQLIEADTSVMFTIARLMQRYKPSYRRYRPVEVVREFSRIIHRELDMSIEGSNVRRFRELFKDDKRIQIPRVYWDVTSEEVLCMERLTGVPIDEIDKIKAMGLDIKKIAVDGIKLFFKQVFEFGVFHADLHPGNIFVREDGIIVYLDFGIVGRLDRDLRRYLASMLFYLIKEDYRRMAQVHVKMGLISKKVDIFEFEEALRDISEPIHGRNLEKINISSLLMKLIHTARRFEMTLQPNLLLLQKSMVIIEGVGRQLYPDINMWEVARPLIYKWMVREKLSPKDKLSRSGEETLNMATTLLKLPSQASEIFERTLAEELKIGFVHHGIEDITDKLDGVGKKIARGLVVSSFVLGSFVFAAFAPMGTGRFIGLPLLSWLGLGAALALSIYSLIQGGYAKER